MFQLIFSNYDIARVNGGAKMSQATSSYQPAALFDILRLEDLSLGLYNL